MFQKNSCSVEKSQRTWSEDRYNTRTYDRYERDRYDSRLSYERSPSETRGYGYGGYESRDRYYPSDRSNDYYRGGDRYPDRNRGSSGGGIYDRYGQDDRYYSRYDYRNYRPWDETYSSPYGGGRGVSRPLSGSYLLDRDNNNVPETSNMAINPDKPVGDSQISDSPTASKLTSSPSSSSSSTSKLTEDRVTESKDSN
ncbi:uncharacterized protein DDB_G0283697-like [Episyrphus balteatus]|uniref:uncharacterized protein DDB_G0283697-like n=1 Tax=Episyrphus balteatus TaxID=286459 RepID=UPI00248600E5|nr:uncharacterized protein DDB_G0283697-like [Episyrphus balteatus]